MIRFAEEARSDLRKINRRLRPRARATITNQVIETILAAVESLDHMPTRGRPGRRPGTRELAITRYPYLIIYEIDGEDVNVARVMHTRQLWPPSDEDEPSPHR